MNQKIRINDMWLDNNNIGDNLFVVRRITKNKIYGKYIDCGTWYKHGREKAIEWVWIDQYYFRENFELISRGKK